MFEKILVGLDGSALAEQILPYAIAEASSFHSQMTLLQIISVQSTGVVEAGAAYQQNEDLARQTQRELQRAQVYLKKVADSIQDKGIKVEIATVEATSAGTAIVEYADKHEFNLIALATHGHGGIGRLVFGSVADYVLRESGLPVLVVKPKHKQG